MARFLMGKRILKTGLAVFITAQICDWLGWPSIFAIIVAIVSIEPSVDMSIKKGMYRLPSAAIGAMFAMCFDALMGQHPVTYMLSAVATIYVIRLLKWNDSLVIATLTSVNMITLTDANFGENFLVRLGTTAIGITVSALVNYLISPPNYNKLVHNKLPALAKQTFALANEVVKHGIYDSKESSGASLSAQLQDLQRGLAGTLQNINWQLADYRYKSPNRAEVKQMVTCKRAVEKLQIICSYLHIMIHCSVLPTHVNEQISDHIWEQWLRFGNHDPSIQSAAAVGEVDDDRAKLLIESMLCYIKNIHILLRQLPSFVQDGFASSKR